MSYNPFHRVHRATLAEVERTLAHRYEDHWHLIFKQLNKHATDLENNPKLFAEIELAYPIVKQEFTLRKSCVMVLQVVYASST